MLEPATGVITLPDDLATPPDGLPGKDELENRLDDLRKRMVDLHQALGAERKQALLVVLQGRDASGKDGTVWKVFGPLNPALCDVTSFKVPTDLERRHDYLWRIHQAVPPRGIIGIFNRSHYEDVLVVRVDALAPEDSWRRRFEEINAFERYLAANDVTILKFFLHISRKEQRKRLEARLDDPSKNWKFEPGDLAKRDQWEEYTDAYEEVLTRCSTEWAPWYVVPADSKPARNYLIAERVVAALERMDPKYPDADPDIKDWRKKIRK